jgi:AcrR family transcriptional regulator
MPTPAKTSRSGIIGAARELIVGYGVDGLTMQAVAERVGVRGPSLYKHFGGRADLLRAVERTVVAELESALTAAGTSRDDKAALRAMAAAYRRFARESAAAYTLIFALRSEDEATESIRRRALEPALARLTHLLGNRDVAFVRARVLTAFLHGFASMEAAGAFRLGGNIDEAFRAGVELLLTGPGKSTTPNRLR